MDKICVVCGTVMDLIPAGVSKKTGRPYNAFHACPRKCVQPRPQQPAPLRSPQLPQEPNYAPQNTGGQILVSELQSLRAECKDYFKQLDMQNTDTFNKLNELKKLVGDLEKAIINQILGSSQEPTE